MSKLISIILLLLNQDLGQMVLRGSEKGVEPIPAFSFLFDGKPFEVTSKVSLENFDLLVKVDFDIIQLKEMVVDFNSVVKEWPKLPFFNDQELKIEYISLCYEGQRSWTRLESNLEQIIKFKNNEIDVEVNTCTYVSHEIKLEDFNRGTMNLRNRYNQVKVEWTPDQVKTDLSKKNTLVLFCKQFAEFTTIWDDYTGDMLGVLQELSDRIYPELLVSQLDRNCTGAIPGEGESFTVTSCKASKDGYRCQIEVAKATETKEYIRVHPVHYENIHISGEDEKQIFGKDSKTGEIQLLDCSVIVSPDFPSCIVSEIEPKCKVGLALDHFDEVLNNCFFNLGEPELTTPLTHGGVFVQGDSDVQVSNGQQRLQKIPPIALYSPLPITIRENEEDLVYPPSINVTSLIVVESKLSPEQIYDLVSTVKWNLKLSSFQVSDYIRYALILIQAILFPMAIVSLVYTIKQRKVIHKLISKRGMEKDNFKKNEKYLLYRKVNK